MLSRIEKDEYGEMELPLNAYYGIKSLRNKENFTVTKLKIYKQLIKSLAIVKKACVLSNYDAGYLSLEKTKALANACDEVINGRFNNQFITDAVQGGSCTAFNNNMNEVLANRATEMLGGELGKYDLVTTDEVNLFQSPHDVVPSAAKHAMIILSKDLIVELKKTQKTFLEKAKKYKKVIKLGRNHLQDGLPITFGQLFNSMASTLGRDIIRLQDSIKDLYTVNLGTGSIGLAYYSDDKYIESILKRFNEFTKMEFTHPENTVDETRNLDEFVNLAHTLKLIAVNLSKTTSDIRMMASGPINGFNEIIIPEFENMSGLNSAQSGQTIPEIVNQVCFLIIGKEAAVTFAAERGEMEVNAFASIVYSLLFDCLEYLTRVLKMLREYCLEGMIINEENCKEQVQESKGIIVGLLGKVDYKTCLDIISISDKTGKSIKEVCMDMQLMSEEKLDALLDVNNLKIK